MRSRTLKLRWIEKTAPWIRRLLLGNAFMTVFLYSVKSAYGSRIINGVRLVNLRPLMHDPFPKPDIDPNAHRPQLQLFNPQDTPERSA